ncbi:MAG: hypothetical protein ACMUHU_02760 [Thermoplasmatota archaeon]
MNRSVWVIGLLLIGIVAAAGCLEGGEDDEEKATIMINGNEYVIEDIFDDFTSVPITSSNDVVYTGVPLKDLLEDAGVSDLSASTYRITASDDYMKEVTHLDIEKGILVEEDIMTAFPELPGKYRVKDVVSIEPIEGDTITVNGKLFTWMQPFDLFTENVLVVNETTEYEGVLLSDLINATSLVDPQLHNFTLTASDDYEQEVTWDDMLKGILVNDEDHMTYFPHLSKKYQIKDIVEISVV